jgi:hypothetical protein
MLLVLWVKEMTVVLPKFGNIIVLVQSLNSVYVTLQDTTIFRPSAYKR